MRVRCACVQAAVGERKGAGVFSGLIVLYLFLGGTGAGLALALAVAGLLVPRAVATAPSEAADGSVRERVAPRQPVGRVLAAAGALAAALLGIGAVCLLLDLGDADRALLVLTSMRVTHLSVGTWALVGTFACAVALGCAWAGVGSWRLGALRAVEGVAVICSIATMAYTGLLLRSLDAVPLWATPWLPALFVASAASCGIAALVVAAHAAGVADACATLLRRAFALDAGAIVLEAICAFGLVTASLGDATGLLGASLASGAGVDASAGAGGAAATPTALSAALSAHALVAGEHAWLFWGGFVGVGLAVPLVLDVLSVRAARSRPAAQLVAAGCVLAGGACMRACIVAAGMHPVLASMGAG